MAIRFVLLASALVLASPAPVTAATAPIECPKPPDSKLQAPPGFVRAGQPQIPPGFVPVERLSQPEMRYPALDIERDSEGWVSMTASIGPDGHTFDVTVRDRMASQTLTDAAVHHVQGRRYKPATLNGRPVIQYRADQDIKFVLDGVGRQALHPTAVDQYKSAKRMILGGHFAEAAARLDAAFKAPLNLAEQASLSYLLAIANLRLDKPKLALQHIRHAALDRGQYLNPRIAPAALRLQALLEATDGNFGEAICFPALQPGNADEDELVSRAEIARVASEVQAALASPAPIGINASLSAHPWIDGKPYWSHWLLRNTFAFERIKGAVTSFRVVCIAETFVETNVSDTAQWTVPANAGPCSLDVYGTEGTTFTFVEAN